MIMSNARSTPTRRSVLAVSAAAAAGLLTSGPIIAAQERGEGDAIRPFAVHVPNEALVDLRRRIAATRWPDKETVSDRSQGVQLATFKPLLEYWGSAYD